MGPPQTRGPRLRTGSSKSSCMCVRACHGGLVVCHVGSGTVYPGCGEIVRRIGAHVLRVGAWSFGGGPFLRTLTGSIGGFACIGGIGFDGELQTKMCFPRDLIVNGEAVNKSGARRRRKSKIDQRPMGPTSKFSGTNICRPMSWSRF